MVNIFLRDMLSSANPAHVKGPNVTVREVLDEAAEQIETQLSDEPEIEAAIRETIGLTYWKLDEIRPGATSSTNNVITRYSRTVTSASSGTESNDGRTGDTTNTTGWWFED